MKLKLLYTITLLVNILIAKPETETRIINADFNLVKGKTTQMPKKAGKLLVKLENIPEGKYLLDFYKTGYRVNDVYSDFVDLGSPTSPTQKQIAELSKKK